MSFVLSVKAIVILILAVVGGSLGGIAYYYQSRTSDLNSQVANLSSNANSLSDQITLLKAEIANLTSRISQLQTVNFHLNQTSLQLQSLQTELAAANAALQSLSTQLSNEVDKVQALEASFNTQLDSLRAQLVADQAEIVQLHDMVTKLESQLAAASGLCSSGKTILIGELLDLSADLSTIGSTSRDASLLATSDINSFLSSTGCNLRFALNIDDYALDNTRALLDLQSFAVSGIQVVVGPLNSGTALHILSYADANHIVLISPSSTSPALAIPGDYLFRTVPNDAAQSLADARMMKDRNATALIMLARDDTYGEGLATATGDRFVALGGHVIDNITYDHVASDAGTLDWTATLTRLDSDFSASVATYGASHIAIDAISFEEFARMIVKASTFSKFPWSTIPWFGTDGEAQDPVILASPAGTLVSQVRLPSTVYASQNNSKTISFYTRFASTYPGTVCAVTCLGAYDDVWLAALATLQVGSYNGTKIQAAMLTVAANYYGITGWLGLNQAGDRIASSYQIWKVVNVGSPPSPTWILAGVWDSSTDSITWRSPP